MTDLGALGNLASAIGLLQGGSPNTGWFAHPDTYLAQMLSNGAQRDALVATLDELFGSGDATTDATAAGSRTWVPIVDREQLPVRLFLVLDVVDGGRLVHLGVGVKLDTGAATASGVGVALTAYVPIFAAGGTQPAPNLILLGTADGTIELDLGVVLPTSADIGGLSLRAVELGARIPTGGAVPSITLALRGLRMPGAAAPADLVVDPTDPGDLGGTVLQLVLSLVQAQTAALPAGDPARALAGLLGLVAGDAVPDFPIAEVLSRGPIALAPWWAGALQGAAKTAWLAHLAALLGGTVDDGAVRIPLGAGRTLDLGFDVAPGAGALPRVIPRIALTTTAGRGVTLALEAQPIGLDLSTGAAVALPALRLVAKVAGEGGPLLGPVPGPGGLQLTIGSIEGGFALDADRRPVLVLAALDATVGTTHHDRLDLSSADAIAAAGAQAVGDVAGALFDALGPVGGLLQTLLGLTGPGPHVDPVRLLGDPIGAVREHWLALLDEPPATVRAVLTTLQGAIADAPRAAETVLGEGTAADPYRLAVTDGVDLVVVRDGSRVSADLALHRTADVGTVARASFDGRVGVLRADLSASAPAASFGTGLLGVLAVTGPGGAALSVETGGFTFGAGAIGARVVWTPGGGARLDPWLDAPTLTLDGDVVDLAGLLESGLAVGGPAGLALSSEASPALPPALPSDPAAWAASTWGSLETLAGTALRAAGSDAAGSDAMAGLLALAGWAGQDAALPRLSLAALFADPGVELARWARALLGLPASGLELTDPASVQRTLRTLAALAGLEPPAGAGLPGLPWTLPFPGLGALAGAPPAGTATDALSAAVNGRVPALGLVAELAGSTADRLASAASATVNGWASGDAALPFGELLEAIGGEAAVDTVLGDLLAGRTGLADGLEGLVTRWADTDGVVSVIEGMLPAGLTLHRPAGLTNGVRLDDPLVTAAVAAAVGAPSILVLVGVVAPGEPDVLPADAPIVVDLTAAGVAPGTFPLPPAVAAGGTAVVRLPGKADAIGPDGGTGFDAQVARLHRVLAALAPAGAGVTVVAGGAAGRVAVAAAAGTGASRVVTVGTPWTPVSLADADAPTTGEAVRWLRSLAEVADAASATAGAGGGGGGAGGGGGPTPDSDELALARRLVGALLQRDERGDPLTELAAPQTPLPAGIDVHAVVGSIDAGAVRSAITALITHAIGARGARRLADGALAAAADALAARIPASFGVTGGGLRASLSAEVDLLRSIRQEGLDAFVGERTLRLVLRVSGDGRWLVGGPDPARAALPRPLALRALTIEASVPFAFADPAATRLGSARIVLHDASVLGVHRGRWEIDPATGSALLPELRALLGEVAATIQDAAGLHGGPADPGILALRELLTAVGVLGDDGGFDAATLANLLGNPAAVLRSAMADPSRRAALAAALRQSVGDGRTEADAGATVRLAATADPVDVSVLVDLAAVTATVSLRTRTVELEASLAASGANLSATLAPHPAFSVIANTSVDAALHHSLSVRAQLGTGGTRSEIPLWPAGPATLDALAAALPTQLGATALDLALRALRELLHTSPDSRIDPLLDAVGLLSSADAAGVRALRWTAPLLADPGGWLDTLTGGLPAALPDAIDAVRGLVSPTLPPALPPARGTIPIAPGVVLQAAPAAGGLRIGLGVDAAAFDAAPGGLVLVADLGVAIDTSVRRARPDVSLALGATPGSLLVRVGTDAGGADARVGATVSLRPAGGTEVVLFPAGRGLGGFADAAAHGAVAALPLLLTRLAAEDGAGDPVGALAVAARFVSRVGVALGLAAGVPVEFTAERLAGFVTDPVAALSARASALAADGLDHLVAALTALHGSSPEFTVTAAAGVVSLQLGPADRRARIDWNPGAKTITASVHAEGLPGIGSVTGGVTVHATNGLTALQTTIGPASIPLGGLVLAPFARFTVGAGVGAGAGAGAAVVDLGLSAGGESRFLARFSASGVALAAERGDLAAPIPATAPADVVRAVLGAVLDLAGGLVLSIDAVRALLDTPVGPQGTHVGELLDGVLLAGPADARVFDSSLVADLGDAGRLAHRLGVLLGKVADTVGPITIEGVLEVGLAATGGTIGLTLGLVGGEWVLDPDGEVRISLVTDADWINPAVPAGLTLTVLELAPESIHFAPALVVGGLGVRVSRSSGPLLNAGITIESLSLLLYGEAGAAGLGGGLKLALEGLGLPLGGASGGGNSIAKGVMPSGGAGDRSPQPKFSPSLALQKHPGGTLGFRIAAGDGNGPWWLRIQREFGPVYLEQVGLAIDQTPDELISITVLIDGKVSLFGFSAAVDQLSLTYTANAEPKGSPFEPDKWSVDVAGFAITADTGGLTLAGGLRRFTIADTAATGGNPGDVQPGDVEYLGMLLARFGPYGLSVYGGFGEAGPPGDRFSSLFLFGAVNGPIGGVPAFFITGIGGGFGVNRGLVVPSDLSQFASFPLVKALDPAAKSGDPFTELERARSFFPAERGSFWFAAGISFNSFALVDGVAVVAVEFGNGFELSILGLARMALPRPGAELVRIELALVARFSASEGVILVQAQLTDNSWLLVPSVRLTGGFAFATWFAGAHRGEFVISIGGYHPDFHRDGYPVVPRLGLVLQFGDFVSIRGEAYFALTSEALMAGVRVDVQAQLGPAWAHLTFGADLIIFFDPFFMEGTVYASVDAGITIDLWFAEVTISVHLSAKLTVSGPPFHIIAELEIGPVSVGFEIGEPGAPPKLDWPEFVQKYLEAASADVGRALSAVTGTGTVPPSGRAADGGDSAPDGQPDRPFRVVAEFTATVVSTMPLLELQSGGRPLQSLPATRVVGIAPMAVDSAAPQVKPRLTLSIVRRVNGKPESGGVDFAPRPGIGFSTTQGAFPVGVWGQAQDVSKPQVPEGEMLGAVDRVTITAAASVPSSNGAPPPEIPYHQVEVGIRRILPLLPSVEAAQLSEVTAGAAAALAAAQQVASGYPDAPDDTAIGERLLVDRGGRTPFQATSWRAALAAPTRLGSLGEALGSLAAAPSVVSASVVPAAPASVRPPQLIARYASPEPPSSIAARAGSGPAGSGPAATGLLRTSVSAALLAQLKLADDAPPRVAPPTLDSVAARIGASTAARLVRSAPRVATLGKTVVPTAAPSLTLRGSAGSATVLNRAASAGTARALLDDSSSLLGAGGLGVRDGAVLVVELPDSARDVREARPVLSCTDGTVRVVVTGGGGSVRSDRMLAAGDRLEVPVGARNVVVVGAPALPAASGAWSVAGGWTADRALPSASDGLLLAAGCVVDVPGRAPVRGSRMVPASWATPAELLAASASVTTVIPAADAGRRLAAVAVLVTGSGTEGLAIGLSGASETGERFVTSDVDGAAVLVIGVRPDPDASLVTVSVAASGEPRRFGGFLAASVPAESADDAGADTGAAGALAGAIAERGARALVPPPTAPGIGTSRVRWEEGSPQ